MSLIAIRALAAFTVWTGTQMIVFNPAKVAEDGDVPATEAEIPAAIAHAYCESGVAEYVNPDDARMPEPEPQPVEANEPETVIGGGGAAENPTGNDDDHDVVDAEFTMTHLGRGKYEITGPGIDDKTTIQGKADAISYIEGVKAALAAKNSAPVE